MSLSQGCWLNRCYIVHLPPHFGKRARKQHHYSVPRSFGVGRKWDIYLWVERAVNMMGFSHLHMELSYVKISQPPVGWFPGICSATYISHLSARKVGPTSFNVRFFITMCSLEHGFGGQDSWWWITDWFTPVWQQHHSLAPRKYMDVYTRTDPADFISRPANALLWAV